MSPAVNYRGDLRRLNYNKTVFGQGSAPEPAGRAHKTLFQTPELNGEELSAPHFPPLSSLNQRAPHSPSELVPHFLDQSYSPLHTRTAPQCTTIFNVRQSYTAHVIAIGWTSVRPSVCHTLVLCRNNSTIVKLSSLPGSPVILVF